MKIVRVISFLVSVIFYNQLSAQNKNFPGFYITTPGDTVKGVFSNYRQWNQSPVRVDFIDAANSRHLVLTPENCLKFSIENYDEYVSYSGQRITNPVQDEQVMSNKGFANADYQYSNISGFLRLLSRSEACDLYIFSDNKRKNFFYKLPGQPLSELKYKKNFDQNRIYDVTDYRQQLMDLFPIQVANMNLTTSLNRLAYNEKEMVEFFDKLHVSEKPAFKLKNPVAGWVFLAGVSVNQVKVTGDKSIDKVRKNYGTSMSPLLSLRYVFAAGRNFNRYIIFPQIKVFSYKNTGQLDNGTFKHVTTFKAAFVVSLELNAGVNLVNKENLQFYLSGGGGMMALSNHKETSQSYVAPNTSPYSSSQTDLSKMSYTFNVAAGATLQKRIVVSAAYNFLTPIGNYTDFTPTLGGVQLGLGYKLN